MTHSPPIISGFTESGDDVYGKPSDGDFSGVDWADDSVSAIELALSNVFYPTLDRTKSYVIYLNVTSQSFTADAGTDVITASAHGLVDGDRVRFKGNDLPAGITQSVLYYVRDKTTNTFKVAATSGGAAVDLTDAGSGTMVFNSPALRSSSDQKIGAFGVFEKAELTTGSETSLATAILASGDADGLSVEESLKILLAAMAGKATISATSSVFRAVDDSKPRITATTTASGNRTAITLDKT